MATHSPANPLDQAHPAAEHHFDDWLEPVLVFGTAAMLAVALLAEMIFIR